MKASKTKPKFSLDTNAALYLKVSSQSSPEEFALSVVKASNGLGVRELADQLRSRFKLPDKETARALVQAMLENGVLRPNKAGRLMAR